MIGYIRNFVIVAHVNHGKSTLADRLLELTGTIAPAAMRNQVLDSNPIERERGITIKLAPVRMEYQGYIFNLIDTPGHVDFSYEVSRSLAACEGALLVVDATQGVQAQTLAYMKLVKERELTVIPVVNKIDLAKAQIEATKDQLCKIFGFPSDEIITISAKKGTNINTLPAAIIDRVPAPRGKVEKPLRALVFSSHYHPHRGVIVFVRLMDGVIKKSSSLEKSCIFMASGASFSPQEVGYFTPEMKPSPRLSAGEVGYLATGLKDIHLARVGDTVAVNPAYRKQTTFLSPLPGYIPPKPMVFLDLYPLEGGDFPSLKSALEKLHLADSAFSFRPVFSPALGKGFHCGFSGILHSEVVQERLEREFEVNLVSTAPTVEYLLTMRSGDKCRIQAASQFPDPSEIKEIKEPIMMVTIFSPKKYFGSIMKLAQNKRSKLQDIEFFDDQCRFRYSMPLSEMVVDFFDKLKSISSGYASLDYEFFNYQPVDVVKLDIFVHYKQVDALSNIVSRDRAQIIGRTLVDRLKKVIPRQQFEVPIQAAIGGRIIARSTVKAYRKNVTAKLYGGDRTRKDKLLIKQKKGKKRLKLVGKVQIPQEAFLAVLKR